MFRRFKLSLTLLTTLLVATGCSALKEKDPDPSLNFMNRKLTPEESKKLAEEAGGNWLYGQGFGETLVSVGGIVAFPPYAIYVLGNGAISLCGYEPLHVTKLLPVKARTEYDFFYDGMTSGPGRLSAAVAGKEYRNTDVIRERYKHLLQSTESSTPVKEHS